MRYDIANPTTSRRVIYDGIISAELLARKETVKDENTGQMITKNYEPHAKDMKAIVIESGEIAHGVELHPTIAARMIEAAKKSPAGQVLQIREHVPQESGDLGDPVPAPARPFIWPDQQ